MYKTKLIVTLFLVLLSWDIQSQDSDPIFPLAEGNYWVYETEMKDGGLKIDTVIVGEEVFFEGLLGWRIDSPAWQLLFGLWNPVHIATGDTIFSAPEYSSGDKIFEEFLNEIIFPKNEERISYTYLMYRHGGVTRNIYYDKMRSSTQRKVYVVQTSGGGSSTDGEQKIHWVTEVVITQGIGITERFKIMITEENDYVITEKTTLIEYRLSDE